jgi:hypothetical protein
MSRSAIGIGGFGPTTPTGCVDPTITRLHAPSNTAAISSADPRRHRDSVSTIGAIVSPAGRLAGQARVPDRCYRTDD